MGKNQELTISLENVLFRAYHGVFPLEKIEGNEFKIDIEVTINAPNRLMTLSDNIGDSVSYAAIYEIIAEEMKKTRNLLETVVLSISRNILQSYPNIIRLFCKITKLHPPIKSFEGQASVSYKWEKE